MANDSQWSGPKDARDEPGAGKYPNYWIHRTRSGHVFILDDSKGAEHITLQHRGGSMIQFKADNSVQIVANENLFTLTFGDNDIKITGAHNVTIDKGATFRVKGDYDVTVEKDINIAAKGNFNLNAMGNINMKSDSNIDIVGKNMNTNIEGNINQTAKGAQNIAADFGLTLASTKDSVAIMGQKNAGIYAKAGNFITRSGQKTSISAGNGLAMATEAGSIGIETDNNFEIKSSKLRLKSNDEIHMKAQNKFVIESKDTVKVKSENDPLVSKPWIPGSDDAEDANPLTPDDITDDSKFRQEKPAEVYPEGYEKGIL